MHRRVISVDQEGYFWNRSVLVLGRGVSALTPGCAGATEPELQALRAEGWLLRLPQADRGN
jgi:hypothetical protein